MFAPFLGKTFTNLCSDADFPVGISAKEKPALCCAVGQAPFLSPVQQRTFVSSSQETLSNELLHLCHVGSVGPCVACTDVGNFRNQQRTMVQSSQNDVCRPAHLAAKSAAV